jgi:hypothetical protein
MIIGRNIGCGNWELGIGKGIQIKRHQNGTKNSEKKIKRSNKASQKQALWHTDFGLKRDNSRGRHLNA